MQPGEASNISPYLTQKTVGPGRGVEEVTLSDTVNATSIYRFLWVQAAGDVAVCFLNDYVRTFTVAAGGFVPPFPCYIKRVNNTNTTVAAANILGVL